MLVRRIPLALITAVVPLLVVLSAEPAMADSVITSSFNTEVAHPGDTLTLTVTFTNPETVDVTFTYLSVNTVYDTITDGTKYSLTGCSGEISSCDHYTVPIPPGGTRTLTQTWEIAADSPCGESTNLAFFFYSYRESSAGAFDTIASSPRITVLC